MIKLRMAVGGGVAATLVCLALAGPLDPPAGPVSPTGKPIGDVEPRIAVNAANTPGNATAVFRITAPGSYCLTANLIGASGQCGVSIEVSNVTLDLKGFTLTGAPGTTSGVLVTAGLTSVTVRNGTVTSWGQTGLNDQSVGSLIEDVRATQNGLDGLILGTGSVVHRCTARSNTGIGIAAGTASTVDDCAATGNTSNGFSAGGRVVFRGCSAEGNSAAGFSLSFGSVAVDCVSGSNTGQGFLLHQGGIVQRCMASTNTTNGFESDVDGLITDCASDGNGTSGAGAGILATNINNRIESSNCTDNRIGVSATGTKNFIVRNTCSGNTTNWSVAIGNKCLVVLGVNTAAAISGDSGGTAIGSTDPNANSTY